MCDENYKQPFSYYRGTRMIWPKLSANTLTQRGKQREILEKTTNDLVMFFLSLKINAQFFMFLHVIRVHVVAVRFTACPCVAQTGALELNVRRASTRARPHHSPAQTPQGRFLDCTDTQQLTKLHDFATDVCNFAVRLFYVLFFSLSSCLLKMARILIYVLCVSLLHL